MRGLAVLTVAFVFASSALFVGSASAQATGSLSGMVCTQPYYAMYDSPDSSYPCGYGQGLPGATVTLTRSGTLPVGPSPVGPTTASATSDANGLYSFSNLATGDYTFKVVRTGFKDLTGTVTVGSGSQLDHAMTGNVVDAKGTVKDPDGAAIAKATLHLCCDANGSKTASTGADGRFSVAVQAGHWSIDVQAPGFQPMSQSLLVDGSDIAIQLLRIPPQDGRLDGVVKDQDGNPVADARVSLYSYGGCCYAYAEGDAVASDMAYSTRPSYYSGENYTFTDAQGRFSMGAYSGENGLSVFKDGYAHHNRGVTIAKDTPTSVEVEILKFPPKTARIEGKVVDAKTGDGVPNVYVSLQSPEYGIYECSESADGSSGGGSDAKPMPAIAIAPGEPMPAYQGCAIKTRSDGTFEGMVTPGYAILSISVDWYASCAETGDADGSFRRECGPEYYSWSTSHLLEDNATTTFDVRLRSRPAPDAEVSGYVVDAETGKAIPGAQVSFSNQDTYGYGYATTDGDGSYRLRLRSGYHSVSVWAEGHLRWEGVLDVAKGDTPFDVEVQPGTESYGGCCYGPYYGGVAYDSASVSKSSGAGMATSSPAAGAPSQGMDSSEERLQGEQGEQYQDLGGGLGPYDASKRADQLDPASDGSPGLGLIAMLAAIGAVFVLRRRFA
jgi:hypothetical protein